MSSSLNEKFNLISMLCTGTLLKIYPYTSEGGEFGWYSLADRLPGDMPYEEWAFVTGNMNYVAEKVAMKDDAQIISLLEKICEYQIKKAGDVLPSEMVFKAEKIYNSTNWNKPLAMFCMTLGIIAFLVFCLSERRYRWLKIALSVVCACIFAYLTFHIVVSGFHLRVLLDCPDIDSSECAQLVTALALKRKNATALLLCQRRIAKLDSSRSCKFIVVPQS